MCDLHFCCIHIYSKIDKYRSPVAGGGEIGVGSDQSWFQNPPKLSTNKPVLIEELTIKIALAHHERRRETVHGTVCWMRPGEKTG